MGVQAARASTTARPFMRLRPQNIAVQVPANPEEASVQSAPTSPLPLASLRTANCSSIWCKYRQTVNCL